MKKSIIKEVLYGNRGCAETINVHKSEKLKSVICESFDRLKERLTPEQFCLHETLIIALEKSWGEDVDNYFVEGFKIGLLIGIKCME